MKPNHWIASTVFFFLLTCLSIATRTPEAELEFREFWQEYSGLLISLIAFVAAYILANLASVFAGEMQRRTKVAEFRQAWINDFRNDLAEFVAAVGDSADDNERTNMLLSRMHLRLHEDEDGFFELNAALNDLSRSRSEGDYLERADAALDTYKRFFKREWEKIKSEMEGRR